MMSPRRSSHICHFVLLLFFVCAVAVSAKTAAVRSSDISSMVRELPLPALARNVEYQGDLGQGWQITGSVSGSLVRVEKDFQRCLTKEGWSLARDYSLRDTARSKLHLYEWTKDGCLLLLMIEQRTAGLSHFRLGITHRRTKDQP